MLRFNGLSPTGANPFSAIPSSFIGNTSLAVGTTSNLTTQWGRGARHSIKLSLSQLTSNPTGTEPPVAWTMADTGGELSAENSVNQSASIQFNLQKGINFQADIAAANVVQSALSMVAALASDVAAGNSVSATMQMTMSLASDMAQQGDMDAALGLVAWCAADMAQTGTLAGSNLNGLSSLAASIVSYTELTSEGVRDKVWNALSAQFNNAGTMGEKLNAAGSAGDPWTGLIEDGLTAKDVMKLLLAVAAGSATGLEGTTMEFKSQNGTVTRVRATYNAGERTITLIDAT